MWTLNILTDFYAYIIATQKDKKQRKAEKQINAKGSKAKITLFTWIPAGR